MVDDIRQELLRLAQRFEELHNRYPKVAIHYSESQPWDLALCYPADTQRGASGRLTIVPMGQDDSAGFDVIWLTMQQAGTALSIIGVDEEDERIEAALSQEAATEYGPAKRNEFRFVRRLFRDRRDVMDLNDPLGPVLRGAMAQCRIVIEHLLSEELPPAKPYLGITLDVDKIARDGEWFRITPQQYRICKALFEARENGLSVDALAEKVWETRPESSRNSLDNRTRELNDPDKLLQLGLTILKNNRGIWSLATI